MADGDAAAGTTASAAGLAVLNGLEKVKWLWRYVNSTRDLIANHLTSGTHDATAINSGTLNAARIPNLDAAKITSGTLVVAVSAPSVASGTPVSTPGLSISTAPGIGFDLYGNLFAREVHSPHVRANPVVSSYVAVYADGSGNFGATPSTRDAKNLLNDYVAPVDSFMKLTFRRFAYKDDPAQAPRLGAFAEDINKEFPELVVHDEQKPTALHKEDFFAVLGSVIQQQETRIRDLETKLAALTERKATNARRTRLS